MRTIGTHNLLDGEAEADAFAEIIMFTEAPHDIHADEVNFSHRLFRSRAQRDLVIALADGIARDITDVKVHYRLVHIGIPTVTPHRGILWITFKYKHRKYAILCEHRINAWYPPYRRGEATYRERKWHDHTRISNRIQRRLILDGYTVIAGGDPNAPEGVQAYPLLHESARVHLDRVACSRRLHNVEVLRRAGSDHHRVRGEAEVMAA